MNCSDVRNLLLQKYKNGDFVVDRTGSKLVELIGLTFTADESYIVREPNHKYIDRELEWYRLQSRFVDDIPGQTPTIWKQIASDRGRINSNYGWCIWSDQNYNQYKQVTEELKRNPYSRRATMLYNRPSMHTDYCADGMNDFMCTYANQFFIRDNRLISHYLMRSNDAVFGYNNDAAWARYVHDQLANELNIEMGELIWTASSFHVYERHFKYLDALL